MAQSNTPQNIGASSEINSFGYDESVALTGATPKTVLIIDCALLRSVTIQCRIDDVSIDGDYTIYGTTKRNPNTSDLTSDEWSTVKASTSLTHNVTSIDTITGNFTYLVVQLISDSGTPVAKAWYKGKN